MSDNFETWFKEHVEGQDYYYKDDLLNAWNSGRAALEQENKELREALEPFAKFADCVPQVADDHLICRWSRMVAHEPVERDLYVGDCRRAKAALAARGETNAQDFQENNA